MGRSRGRRSRPGSTPEGSPTRPEYRIEWAKSAAKELDSIDATQAGRIRQKVESLREDPRPAGVKKLVGMKDVYRVRASDYRILYSIKDDVLTVLVLKVG